MARVEPWRAEKKDRFLNRSYLGKWAFIGSLIGLVAGFGSTAFFFGIQLITNTVLGGITGFYPPSPAGESPAPPTISPHFLLIPISTAIGGLIAGMLVYGLAPEAEGHGTDAAIDAYHNRGGEIRRRVPIVKMISSAFTIGTGGSAGREGPTAQIAAGFGSMLAHFFKLSVRDRRIAVAAGIGAGIGSIFKSPFGGAILSAEILYSGGDIEAEALIPAFIATPIGYVIFSSFTGFTPVFGGSIEYSFVHPFNLIFYAILGVLCAGTGRLYTSTFYSVKNFFDKLRVPRFLRPMIGATIAGIIGIFFPEILGLGYGFVQFAINDNLTALRMNYVALPLVFVLLLLVFIKIFATSVTVGSGGSGGVFAPALGIGAFLGAFFWYVLQYFAPNAIPVPAPLVIVSMMALFAGVGRAPIAVILMVSEMTGSLALLVPSMIAVVISYLLMGTKNTIYRSQVPTKADSPVHRGEYNVPLLSKAFVQDAVQKNVVTLQENDNVQRAAQIIAEKGYKGFPVLSNERLVGIVTLTDVQRIPRERAGSTAVNEIMTKHVITISPYATLLEAMHKMTKNNINRLPVFDENTSKIVGIITRTDIFRMYDKLATTTPLTDASGEGS